MKNSTTAERLKKLMDERNLKQVDILNMAEPLCKELNVKMNKSDISQYVHGKTNPTQEKLYVLCATLGVSEGWLMGHDVPMERMSDADRFAAKVMQPFNQAHPDLPTMAEKQFLAEFRRLTPENQKRVRNYTAALLNTQEADILMAANKPQNVPANPEGAMHDEAIVKDETEWQ